ncbi:hypothetical protein [Blastococcus sp. KM273128]|uniref:hypothetical protein n=1 Tax=Blastococcus sp. KM273128 TaxID=2570314 RepID=UPI001F166070|nr:hypothetical protein [Blastococcus sp. KM273128]
MAVLGLDGRRGAWAGAPLDDGSVTLLSLPDAATALAVAGVAARGRPMRISW